MTGGEAEAEAEANMRGSKPQFTRRTAGGVEGDTFVCLGLPCRRGALPQARSTMALGSELRNPCRRGALRQARSTMAQEAGMRNDASSGLLEAASAAAAIWNLMLALENDQPSGTGVGWG